MCPSALLSFYPFVLVMLSFCHNVLHWRAAEAAIYLALDDSLPLAVGLTLEAMKYVSLLLFPLFRENLAREYGVFQHSALILLWSFAASLVVLAGAYGTAHGAASRSAFDATRQSSGVDPVS
jgi:hypothetical protein